MFDTVIRIEVGEDEKKRTFEVFKGVLCFYSGYFNAALNGRFIEAQEGIVKLPTEDPEIFELFRHWIHTRCLFESTLAPDRLLPFSTIVELWVFCDAHEVPMLQNEVANIMMQKILGARTFPDPETLIYVSDNTVETSPLRKLLDEVGPFLPWRRDGWLDEWFDELRSRDWRCQGHVHEEGVTCSVGWFRKIRR